MFTGIVTEVGTVEEITTRSARARLEIAAERLAPQVAIGDSVAVDGVCLTATEVTPPRVAFDVVTETLRKSTLGGLRPGSRVNLEGALRVGDRLSGHFVMGHVDGVGEIVTRTDEPGQTVFRIRAPEPVTPYLLEKGSIAVNGISLTIWDVAGPEFSIAVIPHTLAETTLGGTRRGARVNLEADVLARWIARMVPATRQGGLTMEKLRDAGYDSGPWGGTE
jgi:riboflavin synthase